MLKSIKCLIVATICVLVMLVLIACTTVPTQRPVGCEDSYIYANKSTIDLVMSVAVMGVHALATTNPAYYRMAHESAQAAAALLRHQPISLSGLTNNLIVNILSPLLGLIPIDKVLSQCDRTYLSDFLLMI